MIIIKLLANIFFYSLFLLGILLIIYRIKYKAQSFVKDDYQSERQKRNNDYNND